jgi:hypothetical protein
MRGGLGDVAVVQRLAPAPQQRLDGSVVQRLELRHRKAGDDRHTGVGGRTTGHDDARVLPGPGAGLDEPHDVLALGAVGGFVQAVEEKQRLAALELVLEPRRVEVVDRRVLPQAVRQPRG